jgi:hypothetical protein
MSVLSLPQIQGRSPARQQPLGRNGVPGTLPRIQRAVEHGYSSSSDSDGSEEAGPCGLIGALLDAEDDDFHDQEWATEPSLHRGVSMHSLEKYPQRAVWSPTAEDCVAAPQRRWETQPPKKVKSRKHPTVAAQADAELAERLSRKHTKGRDENSKGGWQDTWLPVEVGRLSPGTFPVSEHSIA